MTTVFISHAHDDDEFASKLARDLRERGLIVSQPEERLRIGERWAGVIEGAIHNADNILVVLSRKSASSEWLRAEVALALSQDGKRVIPVFSSEDADVPFLLRSIQGVDLSNPLSYRTALDRLVPLLQEETRPRQANIYEDRSTRHIKALLEASMLEHEKLSFEQSKKMWTRALAISSFFVGLMSVSISGLVFATEVFDNVTAFAAFLVAAVAGAAGVTGIFFGHFLSRSKKNMGANK